MQSSNGGINNGSYIHSTTDLNGKTDNTNLSLAVKDSATLKDSDKELQSVDNNNDTDDSCFGCAAAYRRFLSDWSSILLLFFLYILQGLPLGLIVAIPLIMQEKSATYTQQATFSLAKWAFSVKLLWAPLVDALYFKRLGRRKSWLIPAQYLIGIVLLVLSFQVDHLIDTLQIGLLTAYFFLLNFLCASQDMAVDAWGLTMLKRENIGLAPTCNIAGQTLGQFIGHVLFLNLAAVGIVTLSSFMIFWSCVFFVTTTLILIFKPEGNTAIPAENKNTIVKSYMRLYECFKLPAVRWFILFEFSKAIGTSAVFPVSELKLVEYGLAKETKALLTVPSMLISVLIPFVVSRWTVSSRPMALWAKSYGLAVLVTGITALMVWVTGRVKDEGGFPAWYIVLIVLVLCAFKICMAVGGVSASAFTAKISDPKHGATFMTLFSTVSNMGWMSMQAIALALVDTLTITKECDDAICVCDKAATRVFDGYFIELIFCFLFGYCWLFGFGRRMINKLQDKSESEFRLTEKQEKHNNDKMTSL